MASRRLLPEFVWARLPIQHRFHVFLQEKRAFTYEPTVGDQIGRNIFWQGMEGWENETTSVFFNFCTRSSLVIDVGANTGVFSLLACAASQTVRVISFEPVPRVFDRLKRNIQLNGLTSRCELYNMALAEAAGNAQFHIPFADVPSSASLDTGGFRGVEGNVVTVPVTTLDLIVSPGARVDLLKIDVEGFEDRVLEGMPRILGESRPTIIIECLPDGPYKAINSILSALNYRFYHLTPEGPRSVPQILPAEQDEFRNFLCVGSGNVPMSVPPKLVSRISLA